MENAETIKIYSQCPKCGHWSASNISKNWIEKASLVDSLFEYYEDKYVEEHRTKFGKAGSRVFGSIAHYPFVLLGSAVIKKDKIASFSCLCGNKWVSETCYTDKEWLQKIENDIKLASSVVPIEKTYEMLRTIYNHIGVDEHYNSILNELYSKLKTIYLRDFSKIPNYARRFVWVTRNDITSYPENICLLTLKEASTVDTHFENEIIGDTLYVKHPYKNIYYSKDSYSISLFEDEVEDFIDIMACIGAKKINISANDELRRDKNKKDTSSSTLKGNHNGVEIQASENYEIEEERNFKQLIKRIEEHHFNPENRVRRLPQQGEYAWFDWKEKWRRKATRVIEHNELTMDFTLSIQEEIFVSQKETDAIQLDIQNISADTSAGIANTESLQSILGKFHHRELIAHVEFYGEDDIKKEGKVKSFLRNIFKS